MVRIPHIGPFDSLVTGEFCDVKVIHYRGRDYHICLEGKLHVRVQVPVLKSPMLTSSDSILPKPFHLELTVPLVKSVIRSKFDIRKVWTIERIVYFGEPDDQGLNQDNICGTWIHRNY